MIFRKVLTLVVSALVLFNTTSGFATSTNSQPLVASPAAANKDTKLDLGALGPSATPGAAKKVIETTYTQMTYEGLYKLVWSYDAFSTANEDALNTYLIITECNLYNKFFENEFEWEKIKIATREFIGANKNKVPRYYEYVQPIFLGRYDYSLQGFPILDAKDFKGQKNLQFANYQSGDTSCGRFNLDNLVYPATGVVTISSPLNLAFIRVPLNLAEKYIEWRSKQQNLDETKRQAYIRYRIRIDGYEGIKQFSAGLSAFNFQGKLMRLDVFADKDLMLPLYNQVF